MKLFNIILGSLVGLSTVSVPAFAGTGFDCNKTKTNWTFCTQDNGNVGVDVLTMTSPDNKTYTKLEVLCLGGGGNRWESFGNMSKDENQFIATHWCKNY